MLQSARDHSSEFDDLAQISIIVAATLNETDRLTFDEKSTVIKDKYNRLLNNLAQRLNVLEEANRNDFTRIQVDS